MEGVMGRESFAPSPPIFLWLTLLAVLGFEGPWYEKVCRVPMALVMGPLTPVGESRACGSSEPTALP